MYKILISFALLTSSLSYAGYDEVMQKIDQKLAIYEELKDQEKSLYGQWYLGGVIVGLENALHILYMEQEKEKFDNNVFIHQESFSYPN